MRQRLTFIAVEQDNVSGFGLLFAQLQTQADPFHLGGDLATLQRVPRSPPTELFLCNALDIPRLRENPDPPLPNGRNRILPSA
jgi:hypothetical protein